MNLVNPISGEALPPIIDTATAAALLGEHENTVMERCREGLIPTMERLHDGGPWRIITAKFLRQLGLIGEQVPS